VTRSCAVRSALAVEFLLDFPEQLRRRDGPGFLMAQIGHNDHMDVAGRTDQPAERPGIARFPKRSKVLLLQTRHQAASFFDVGADLQGQILIVLGGDRTVASLERFRRAAFGIVDRTPGRLRRKRMQDS